MSEQKVQSSSSSRLGKMMEKNLGKKVKRRSFLSSITAAAAAAVIPVKDATAFSFSKYFQKHY